MRKQETHGEAPCQKGSGRCKDKKVDELRNMASFNKDRSPLELAPARERTVTTYAVSEEIKIMCGH